MKIFLLLTALTTALYIPAQTTALTSADKKDISMTSRTPRAEVSSERHISLNQLGYLPNAPKFAMLASGH
jgi:hypothetical protein